jgi:type VI protein secretion system component Hcp
MKFSRATRSSFVVLGAASLVLAAGVAPASAAPTVSELTVTKVVDKPSTSLSTSLAPDKTSDILARYCSDGKHYPTAELTVP